MSEIELTVVLIKPDALLRGLMGRIIQRFEEAGLKIVNLTMRVMDDELIRLHYHDLEERAGSAVYRAVASNMKLGPTVALLVEAVDAVANVRRLIGSTYPNEAAPGTIRGDFAHHSRAYTHAQSRAVSNLVHGSADEDDAARELQIWFRGHAPFSYQSVSQDLTF
ncbi:nucleoside-diphosphate kinase [Micromonospora chersina]|uniref:nucleoside-diphosphate kinase n=1 Tax=Micromonospora chersina TaxID=47854 RepID=UPI003687FB9E